MFLLNINWGNALIVTFIGFSIVFLLLVFLVGVVSVFGYVSSKSNQVAVKKIAAKNANKVADDNTLSGDYAAIAMALHLYFNFHDEESDVITIKSTDRRYSPWNSKIYGVNNIG